MTNNFKQYRNKETGEIIKAAPNAIERIYQFCGRCVEDLIPAMIIYDKNILMTLKDFNQQYQLIENENDK